VLHVFNKIDRLTDRSFILELEDRYSPAVFISATRNINIVALNERLLELLDSGAVERTITFHQAEYGLVSRLHEIAEIIEKKYRGNTVIVRCRVPRRNEEHLYKLLSRSAYAHELQLKTGPRD
jgi:GTP-binding protein HflX